MIGYLNTQKKDECFGCEACVQACPKHIINMQEDIEGFRYPVVDETSCVNCGLCNNACPYENMPIKSVDNKYVFGGYHLNSTIRSESTSGGAFSAIVEAFCDKNYVIFGASSVGLSVYHEFITNKEEIGKFRKSKYSQSVIGQTYKEVRDFLLEGKKVLFSGTPCQIAGLKAYLGKINQEQLLTVEVICEGVPSPLYVRKYEKHMEEKYGSNIQKLDYRYKDMKSLESPGSGKWDFQVMYTSLQSGKNIKLDRWFNPFWSVWLNHLMSRPSCYKCPFTTTGRVADISLGDLWGVHLYCPELYGKNGGSSLIICNTEKGKQICKKAETAMYGHELAFEDALKYQSPMRKSISENPDRNIFMADLESDMDYKAINKKWAKKPSAKLLWQKYIWGNRQKVCFWKLTKGKYEIR